VTLTYVRKTRGRGSPPNTLPYLSTVPNSGPLVIAVPSSVRAAIRSYLGAQYRRLRTPLGAPKAITAMARKLACLFYRLIRHGHQYVDKGTEYYEARYREQQIRSLTKRAQKLGLQLVIPQTVST